MDTRNDQDKDRVKNTDDGKDVSVNSNPKQGKSDPQLTELDGLKKGGTEPTVNPADKGRDGSGVTQE